MIMQNTNIKNSYWNDDELGLLKKQIMRGIYFRWFMRKIFVPAFIVLPIAVVLMLRELSHIALGNIFGTLSIKVSQLNLFGILNYGFVAIRATQLDSLLIMLSSTLLALFFGRKIIRDFYLYWFQGETVGFPFIARKRI